MNQTEHLRAAQVLPELAGAEGDPANVREGASDIEVRAHPRRMKLYADVSWTEIKSLAGNPVEFLRRNGVPLYFRIDRDKSVAFRYYALQHPLAGMTVMRLTPELMFLRLDDRVLSELAVSGASTCSEFTSGGLALVAGSEEDRSDLVENSFQRCYVIDNAVLWDLQEECAHGRMTASRYFNHAEKVLIRDEDVWLSEADLAKIYKGEHSAGEMMGYPYAHRVQVPAVYWMFQAAYMLNSLKHEPEEGISNWLVRKGGSSLFSVKRAGLAAKFVNLKIDRAQGRNGGAKPFKVHDLDNWTDAERFMFPFISDGLTIILAVADWWVSLRADSPDEPGLSLGKKLVEQNFDKTEASYLIRLITGNNLTREEQRAFLAFELKMKDGNG